MNTPIAASTRRTIPAKFLVVVKLLLTGAALAWFTPAAFAQRAVDMGCSPTVANPCTGGSARGSSGSNNESGAAPWAGAARRWIDCNLFGSGCPDQPSPAELKRRQMQALNSQGAAEQRAGNYLEALRLYKLALDMCVLAEDIEIVRQNVGNAHSWLGYTAEKRGDFEQALREYELAYQYFPANQTILNNLTSLRDELANRRQVEEAQRLAELQRRREEEERRANESRARLLAQIRRTDPAPPLEFRLGSTSGTPAIPLTPFSQGAGPANAGLLPRVRDSVSDGGRDALDQLGLAAGHGERATAATAAESASVEASCVFDSPCVRVAPPRAASPQTPTAIEVPQPVTPRLTEIRQQLIQNRVTREKLEKEIEDLRKEPQPRLAEISVKRDELNRAEQQKNYLDFSLNEETVKAAAAPVPSQAATAGSGGRQ